MTSALTSSPRTMPAVHLEKKARLVPHAPFFKLEFDVAGSEFHLL